jgi:hypothetical protein
MVFQPLTIDDDSSREGHLDTDPIYDILLAVDVAKVTGRLTIADSTGANHMFFMQGRPVGVQLAEHLHPLGQLLLELGRVNGQTFLKAQRLITAGQRLAGQVFKEIGVLDDDSLKEVLAIQARRKAEHFCSLGSRPYSFARGRMFLTGFTSTPLDIHAVIYLAIRQQMGPEARALYLEGARDMEIRLLGEPTKLLPSPLPAYGFGPPEERFLQRIVGGWQKVKELAETGTLPREEMAVLLRYLEFVRRLDKRPAAAVPESLDDVFGSSGSPSAIPELLAPTPVPQPEPQPPPRPRTGHEGTPLERTDPRPRQRVALHELPTPPLGEPVIQAGLPTAPTATSSSSGPAPASAAKELPRFRSVIFEGEPETLPPPPKKKKVRRAQPLPSEGRGPVVMETRKEKTQITTLPSIVIADDDGSEP